MSALRGGIAIAASVLFVMLWGCSASRTQFTSQVFRPLPPGATLGRVAVISAISAPQSRPWHTQQAGELRRALAAALASQHGVTVVHSEALLPRYGQQRFAADATSLAQQALARTADAAVDTVCLIHLRDGGGYLTLGLPQLASVWGECDFDLQLIDVQRREAIFASSGRWSQRTDMPKMPLLPTAENLGQELAASLRRDTPPATSALAETSSSPPPAPTAFATVIAAGHTAEAPRTR